MGQSDCRSKCLWFMNHLMLDTRLENIPLFGSLLARNSSNFLEMGLEV